MFYQKIEPIFVNNNFHAESVGKELYFTAQAPFNPDSQFIVCVCFVPVICWLMKTIYYCTYLHTIRKFKKKYIFSTTRLRLKENKPLKGQFVISIEFKIK